MFQLLKLKKADDGIHVIVEYDVPSKIGETVKAEKCVKTPRDAAQWIETAMGQYAKQLLKMYVWHKYVLKGTSRHFSQDPDVLNALNKCIDLVKNSAQMTVTKLARCILNHESELQKILPETSQMSYNSSRWNFDNLINWSHEILYQRKEYVIE